MSFPFINWGTLQTFSYFFKKPKYLSGALSKLTDSALSQCIKQGIYPELLQITFQRKQVSGHAVLFEAAFNLWEDCVSLELQEPSRYLLCVHVPLSDLSVLRPLYELGTSDHR